MHLNTCTRMVHTLAITILFIELSEPRIVSRSIRRPFISISTTALNTRRTTIHRLSLSLTEETPHGRVPTIFMRVARAVSECRFATKDNGNGAKYLPGQVHRDSLRVPLTVSQLDIYRVELGGCLKRIVGLQNDRNLLAYRLSSCSGLLEMYFRMFWERFVKVGLIWNVEYGWRMNTS